MNALINAIQYGFKNARTIMDYEEKRVKQLTNILDTFIKHRGN